MSQKCAYIVLKIVVGIGLLLVLAGVISPKAFADAPSAPAAETPAGQSAGLDDSSTVEDAATGAAAEATSAPAGEKTDGKLFGTKPGDSPFGTRPDNGPDTSALLRQVMALVVVIVGLGFACWFVLKKGLPRFRLASPARPKEITVMETTYLPSRQCLYLLQVGSKKLLLAGGKEGLEMLADVTDGFPERPTDEAFQDVLSKKGLHGSEGNA